MGDIEDGQVLPGLLDPVPLSDTGEAEDMKEAKDVNNKRKSRERDQESADSVDMETSPDKYLNEASGSPMEHTQPNCRQIESKIKEQMEGLKIKEVEKAEKAKKAEKGQSKKSTGEVNSNKKGTPKNMGKSTSTGEATQMGSTVSLREHQLRKQHLQQCQEAHRSKSKKKGV